MVGIKIERPDMTMWLVFVGSDGEKEIRCTDELRPGEVLQVPDAATEMLDSVADTLDVLAQILNGAVVNTSTEGESRD